MRKRSIVIVRLNALIIALSVALFYIFWQQEQPEARKVFYPTAWYCSEKGQRMFDFEYFSHGVMNQTHPMIRLSSAGLKEIEVRARGRGIFSCSPTPNRLIADFIWEHSSLKGQWPEQKKVFKSRVVQDYQPEEGKFVLSFDSDEGNSQRNLLRDLLSKISLKAVLNQNTWKTEEEDLNGPYVALYHRNKSKTGEGMLIKSGFEYQNHVKKDQGTADLIYTSTKESQARFHFSDSGEYSGGLNRIEVTLSQNVKEGETLLAETTWQISFIRAEQQEIARGPAISAMKNRVEDDFTGAQVWERVRKNLAGSTLKDSEPQDLIRELQQEKHPDPTGLYLKLRACLEVCRDFFEYLTSSLSDMDSGHKGFGLGVQALALAGGVKAGEALLKLIELSDDRPTRVFLLAQTGLVENPDKSLFLSLETAADFGSEEENNAKGLALSNLAYTLRDTEPDLYWRYTNELVDSILRDTELTKFSGSLHQLTNLGTPRIYEILEFLNESDRNDQFQLALEGLRLLRDKKSEDYLMQFVKRPAGGNLLDTAVKELTYRTQLSSASLTTLKDRFNELTGEATRSLVIGILGKYQNSLPGLRQWIRQVSEEHSSEDIRRQARLILLSSE